MTNFTDRASYKLYVSRWKTEYAIISEEIRQTKKTMKLGTAEEQSPHQFRREMLRRDARQMLVERMESKVEAQEQYQAQKLAAAL